MESIFDVSKFRELTQKVIAAEKPGFWSDWTAEQQSAYMSGDWRKFSVSRGYSSAEISEYALWQEMIDSAIAAGMNPFAAIKDLADAAAIKNSALDKNKEIAKSSHVTFGGERHFEISGVAL